MERRLAIEYRIAPDSDCRAENRPEVLAAKEGVACGAMERDRLRRARQSQQSSPPLEG